MSREGLPTQNFIDGVWCNSNEEKLKVYHKYRGEVIAEVSNASAAQVEKALTAATRAFAEFRTWSVEKRAAHLANFIDILEQHREQLTQVIIAEAGKPHGYATGEVNRALSTLRWAQQECLRFGGEVVPMDFANAVGKTAFTKRFPIGPITCISPFNFPINLALHKMGPALAVGCPVILKPSPYTPLSALLLAKFCEDAGYPPGFVNILCCSNEHAQQLVTDPRQKMLSFTGSPQIGWKLKSLAGKKKVVLELGGNAAVIVDEETNLQQAASQIAMGAFLYAGQICISTQRIYVQQTVFSAFQEALVKATEALHCGDPHQTTTSVGPLIDKHHFQRVDQWVKEAVAHGAQILCGGKAKDEARNIYAPTILTKTNTTMKVSCEEVFGPVAILESYDSFEEAIAMVNNSAFGLQAGVYTNRLDRLKLAHQELDVGAVIMNGIPGFRIDHMPYGGVKDSGFGREGLRYAMEEMTEPRLLVY